MNFQQMLIFKLVQNIEASVIILNSNMLETGVLCRKSGYLSTVYSYYYIANLLEANFIYCIAIFTMYLFVNWLMF